VIKEMISIARWMSPHASDVDLHNKEKASQSGVCKCESAIIAPCSKAAMDGFTLTGRVSMSFQ
jgi:hypothetical protein